jgi:hypothetical protein
MTYKNKLLIPLPQPTADNGDKHTSENPSISKSRIGNLRLADENATSAGQIRLNTTKKITNKIQRQRKPSLIDGKSLEQWIPEWRRVEGGLCGTLNQFYGWVGLFRIRENGKVVFIGASAAPAGSKLCRRLECLTSQLQTGNNHHGALKIRENIGHLNLDVLLVGRSEADCGDTRALKKLMIQHYQPSWNVHKKAPKN